jgi:hypothetical protein
MSNVVNDSAFDPDSVQILSRAYELGALAGFQNVARRRKAALVVAGGPSLRRPGGWPIPIPRGVNLQKFCLIS